MHAHLGAATLGYWLVAGWITGLLLQFQQAELWLAPWAAAGTAIAAFAVLAAWPWRRRAAGALVLVAGVGLLAFASTTLRAEHRLHDRLAADLEGVDLQVTGVVDDLPRATLTGTRFTLAVEQARLRGQPVRVPQRLSLAWFRGPDDDALLSGPAEDLRAGQRWQLTVRLRQPHGSFNPQGFDLELWLYERGIGATGYVRARPETPALKQADAAGAPVQRARQALRDALQRQVDDPATAGVLAALLLGDQAAIQLWKDK